LRGTYELLNYPTFRLLKIALLAALIATTGLLTVSQAQIVHLSDNGSTADIDTGSSAGMYNWFVGNQNQLNQQWFWYRVGSGGAEAPINTIGPAVITNPDSRNMSVTYANSSFSVRIDYFLTGGSLDSDIAESIRISNLTGSALNFHFFQFSDFNISGTAGGDSVSIRGDPLNGYDKATQTKGAFGVAETVDLPPASRAQAGNNFIDSPTTLARLNDGSTTDLNDVTASGPGDAVWALQWDFSNTTVDGTGILGAIAGNTSVDVIKDKHLIVQLVPEPSSIVLVSLGLSTFLVRRRRSAQATQ